MCAAGYFGEVLDHPFPEPLPDVDADPHADFVAPADIDLAEALDFVDRAWAHADASIAALPLRARGRVPWWSGAAADVTLEPLLVHMVAETHRHAGHADVVREQLDGSTGLRPDASSQPDGRTWTEHVAEVDRTAREAAERSTSP
ncbi:hypothetical protein GCM10009821_06550 [Aeromicrobium halocynthiae]|uniref:DUF664 domain-containing protein n=1 Tax=Aeromicrobium halocynthiae TaxID=560557 RepID=A0ABN2VTW6_9ACTN